MYSGGGWALGGGRKMESGKWLLCSTREPGLYYSSTRSPAVALFHVNSPAIPAEPQPTASTALLASSEALAISSEALAIFFEALAVSPEALASSEPPQITTSKARNPFKIPTAQALAASGIPAP